MLLGGPPAHAQIDALRKALAPGTKTETSGEADEDRVAGWLKEARERLDRLDAPDATLPPGVTPGELESFRDDLEQTIRIASRPDKLGGAIKEASAALKKSRDDNAAWSGFEGGPPKSILVLDELHNERDAARDSLASKKSALQNIQGMLDGYLTEAKEREAKANALLGDAANGDAAAAPTTQWRLDAARAAARLAALRVRGMQAEVEVLRETVATAESDIALLDRKIALASRSVEFTREDLEKVASSLAASRKELEKKSAAVAKRLKEAATARDAAAKRLDSLANGDPATANGALDAARAKRDALANQVETLQAIQDAYENLIPIEDHWREAYEQRFAAMQAEGKDARDEAIEHLRRYRERLIALRRVLRDGIAAMTAEMSMQDSRAATIEATDPRFAYINERRALFAERLEVMRSFLETADARYKIINRWVKQLAPEDGDDSLGSRFTAGARDTWDFLGKIWSFEITHFDDEVVVDGLKSARRVPLTLGMVLRALVFFTIGYWIATKFANRIQTTLVVRRRMEEAHARTLRNWTMIAVGVCLGFATLAFLKIPLTVFALFGGALAIGLGFGTQTLIKNFISGIIVLVERKVRVGDVLEVDGIVGRVVEVNARSSVVRGADDVETMVPNSVFLENRFTNWTLSNSRVRRAIRVGVAYGTPPQKVIHALAEEAARHGLVCKDPEPVVIFEDFGDNALMFCLYYWYDMNSGGSALVVDSDLRIMIEKRLAEMKVGVPFPQRDMHLRTDAPLEVRISRDEP